MSEQNLMPPAAQPKWTENLTKQFAKSRFAKIFSAEMTFMAFKDNLQPWGTFFNPAQFSKPSPVEVIHRVQANLEHFASNYLVVLFVIFFGALLSTPGFLVSMIVIVAIWAYLFSIKTLVISGHEISNLQKNATMAAVTFLVLLVFAWNAILICLGIFSICFAIHAIFHNLPVPKFELDPEAVV